MAYLADTDSLLAQSEYLSILSAAPVEQVQALADEVAMQVGTVEVLDSQIVLSELPDAGEILMTEAQVLLADGTEGFGACLGRDPQLAIAIATLDAALTYDMYSPVAQRIRSYVDAQYHILASTNTPELMPA